MTSTTTNSEKPILIGYLPPLEGLAKTSVNYHAWQRNLINIGDICYTYPGTLIAAGNNHCAWNFSCSAEIANEAFSKVIFFIPCRIAQPPYDEDGFPYELVTNFIKKLKIPFVSVTESIQSNEYSYQLDFHKKLSPKVKNYLYTIANHSISVGTRGEYSAEILTKLGIKNVDVIGCPSLYINGPKLNANLKLLPPIEEIRNVAVCYSNYQELSNSKILEILKLANNNNYHYVEQSFNLIVKILHYPGFISLDDILKAKKIFHSLDEIRDLFRKNKLHYFTNYNLWKNFLSSMDFALGARMHGLTPAIQAGVPALFIAHDARVREMCEFFNLPFIGDFDIPKDVSLDFFYSYCDYSKSFSTYPLKYFSFLDFLRKNQITPNVKENGKIRDQLTAEPLSQVLESESAQYSYVDSNYFDLLCSLEELSTINNYSAIDQSIRNIAQNWYDTRLTLRRDSL